MAPSATTREPSQDGARNAEWRASAGPNDGEDVCVDEDVRKLYTDAYVHGYTEGYAKHCFESEPAKHLPIAIVGMSCRLPGNVSSPDEFWELCSRARDGWSTIPKDRFDSAAFHHPNPGKHGCFNAAGGNFLKEDVGLFDAPFFSLTAQEATSMDPQQRILLECTFEALESAGIPKASIVGDSVGVFVGGTFSEYESQLFQDTDTIPMYQATGCAFAMQSNRISHFFDLRGPSFTMDTACSSSLVALHQACQSLRNNESKSAIVGGCHLNMLPETWVSMSKSRLFSDAGRSFSFDSRGTGYGRGEGCGIVILKTLEQALKDNDKIRSVILASGINQDGRTPGITMPNGDAQESLIRSVYESARLDPKETGYVEAHGTGTKVGDPIEAAALHNVFGEGRSARAPLFVGSVKSNIGHLEAASGIIAVIKTAMMLERGFVLPNFDFKTPNPKIPFTKWNIKVPISQRPWPRPKRFASVNNFGFGGTNAHIVMERAPLLPEPQVEAEASPAQSRRLFVLSANDKIALDAMMKNIGIYLEQRPEVFQNDLMSNVAYTLGQRRSHMQWRVAVSTTSSIDLIQALNSGKVLPTREAETPRIGFIFTGQGAQWHGMGRGLYEQYPVFAATMDACEECLVSLGASFSLQSELAKDAATSSINEAHISQPACTAIQLALTDLLRSWGIIPVAVTGHSSGEIGAAYAAGFLPLDSCMAISYHRGIATKLLKKKFPDLKGSMMAVGCSEDEIAPLIGQLTGSTARIACFNSPSSLTISGDEAAVDQLQKLMEEKQLFNRKLQVDVAYHSHHMEHVAKDYQNALATVEAPQSTQVKFYSSLVGELQAGATLDACYWVSNLTRPVRFSEGLAKMCEPSENFKTGVNMLIEIGPHAALAGPVKQILKVCGPNAAKVSYASALVRNKDAVETIQEVASWAFMRGLAVDLGSINTPKPGKLPTLLVDMPRYPWNHQTRYWHESRLTRRHKNRAAPRHDLIGALANYSSDAEPIWRNILRVDDLPWLRHHQVQSLTVFPMAGFVSMAVEAASQRATMRNIHFDTFELRDISVETPLLLTTDDVEMTIALRTPREFGHGFSSVWEEFVISSWNLQREWTQHCRGLVAVRSNNHSEGSGDDWRRGTAETSLQPTITSILSENIAPVDGAKLYETVSDLGISYGPSFQGMENCRASNSVATADMRVADTTSEMPQAYQTSYIVHPAFLEQLIEMYWPMLAAENTTSKNVYLPSSIRNMTIGKQIRDVTTTPGNTLRAFSHRAPVVPSPHPRAMLVSMFATLSDTSKEPIITIDDLNISPMLEESVSSESQPHRELCYKLEMEPVSHGLNEAVVPLTNGATNGTPENVAKDSSQSSQSCNGGLTNGHLPSGDLPNGVDKTDSMTFPAGDKVLIVHNETASQQLLAANLANALEDSTGKRPIIGNLLDAKTEGMLCLFVSELDDALLPTLTSIQFAALQKLLTSVQGILWVVRGSYTDSTYPDTNMVTGMSRSIRSETLLRFATLDLDPATSLDETSIAKTIVETFGMVFGSGSETRSELEFMERKGTLFTPRIVNDDEMNEYVHKKTGGSTLESTQFLHEDRPLQLSLCRPGALETIHFIDQTMPDILADDEIEIEVKSIGTNSRDLLALSGHLEIDTMGWECSGVVKSVGSTVTSLSVGQRVAAISATGGVYSTYTRTKAAFAFGIRDDVDFDAAASIPVAYCSAYYALITLGRIEHGENVLIYNATSAVGQAAVRLCEMLGAHLFVAVSNSEGKELLQRQFGLPDDQILSSHSTTFSITGLQVSKNRHFDVILSCSSPAVDTMRDLWDSLASFGRFIDLGTSNSTAGAHLASGTKNKTFVSFDLADLAAERPKTVGRLITDVAGLLRDGIASPIGPLGIFSMSDVRTAFKELQKGDIAGKLIISPQPRDMVQATPSKTTKKSLRTNATYILIGGTGGLGRSMARWMAGQGAKNIVLVSRSGSTTGKVKELIDELSQADCNIVVRQCDVANTAAVDQLIRHDLTGLPEIRGVIHGAMVLHDVLFEKMTYDEYTSVIASKVHGAWNFHNALQGKPLDFFVAISSAAGAVGNRGQAAYSAANTFLNAFVQYRNKLGLPASSLDLTAISDVGYLAEDAQAAAEVAKNLGSDTICEAEVLSLLEAAVDGTLARKCNNHTITGMRITPSQQPFWTTDAKFKHLRLAAEALASQQGSTAQAVTVSYNAQLKAAKSLEEAQDVVCRGLLSKLPSVLMLEQEDMDVTRSLADYALDSLVAIEVRNFCTREFEANLQVLELLSSGSIESLAKTICGKSKLVGFEG